MKKLGDVCRTGAGGTPSKLNKEYYENGTIPWLMSGEIAQGDIRQSTQFISELGLKNSSAKVFPCNTVLVAMYGATAGQVGILRMEAATNQAVCGILPNAEFVPEFVYFFMLSQKEGLVSQATGNAQPNISQEKIRNTRIPVPPLAEQQRIVAFLDEAFAGIATARANAEKNLQNARALFESHINAVFTQRGEGWVEKRLGEICAITSNLVDPKDEAYLDQLHVGAGNIQSKTGALLDLKSARMEGLISGKFPFDPSMVLYSKIRPYLMKVARPSFSGVCSADMYPLTPVEAVVTRDYLFHLLLSKPFTDYAIEGSARAGMPKVNRDHLFEYRVWIPNLEAQQAIALELDQLHVEAQRLESIYRRKIAALDEMKKSLLHEAFSIDR
ncbi:MAG: restriction endonuclease subunit S [Candidatus Hydrogenedentes bacterium]|nr:restriction endonuclease subunit S [Candidatus Hydrogenedentota bacterium]